MAPLSLPFSLNIRIVGALRLCFPWTGADYYTRSLYSQSVLPATTNNGLHKFPIQEN